MGEYLVYGSLTDNFCRQIVRWIHAIFTSFAAGVSYKINAPVQEETDRTAINQKAAELLTVYGNTSCDMPAPNLISQNTDQCS